MDYRYNFPSDKRNNKKKIIFVILFSIVIISFAIFMFGNSSNIVVSKIYSTVSYPFSKVYEFFDGVFSNTKTTFSDKEKLQEENTSLKEQIKNLEYSLLEMQGIMNENETLKEQLEIKKVYSHFKIVSAKIIYREHDNWTQTFKIDVGASDGIKKKQAVVHKDGLVGYISYVGESESTVTTILDPSTSVSVNISTINEPAILKGDLSLKSENKLSLTSIPLDAQISIDDMLYTSGLGLMYKSGIAVGKIIGVTNGKNDVNRTAIVSPCVNIRTISEVGIIIE